MDFTGVAYRGKQYVDTWYFHSIHIDFLNKIYKTQDFRHFRRSNIFTLPPENEKNLWLTEQL